MLKTKGTRTVSLLLAVLIAYGCFCVCIPDLVAMGASVTLAEMRQRAEAIVNYEWTPTVDISTWNGNSYNGSKVFSANKKVVGMPYTLFSWELGYDSLLSLEQYKKVEGKNKSVTAECHSVRDKEGNYLQRTGPIYGSCCATFVSEVFGGSYMNSKGNPIYDGVSGIKKNSITRENVKAKDIKAGDAVSNTRGDHVIWIGEVTDDYLVVYEQTPPVARKQLVYFSSHTDKNGYLDYCDRTYSIVSKSVDYEETSSGLGGNLTVFANGSISPYGYFSDGTVNIKCNTINNATSYSYRIICLKGKPVGDPTTPGFDYEGVEDNIIWKQEGSSATPFDVTLDSDLLSQAEGKYIKIFAEARNDQEVTYGFKYIKINPGRPEYLTNSTLPDLQELPNRTMMAETDVNDVSSILVNWATSGGADIYKYKAIQLAGLPSTDGNDSAAKIIYEQTQQNTNQIEIPIDSIEIGKWIKVAVAAVDQVDEDDLDGIGELESWKMIYILPTEGKIAISDFDVLNDNVTLTVGASKDLKVSITPADASNKLVFWSSSAPDIVSVNDGTIVAHSVGSASITAVSADGCFSDTCSVSVEEGTKSYYPTNSELLSVAKRVIFKNETSASYLGINANDNGALSIGKVQWHGNRALNLLKTIVNANPSQAQSLLGNNLYNEILNATNWSTRKLTSSESAVIVKLLDTPESRAAQDTLADNDVLSYIQHAKNLGIVDPGAIVYFADVENYAGAGGSARVAKSALSAVGTYDKIDLQAFHTAAGADSIVGKSTYTSRRNTTFSTLLALDWGDKQEVQLSFPHISVTSCGEVTEYDHYNVSQYILESTFISGNSVTVSWSDESGVAENYTYRIIGLPGNPCPGDNESETAEWILHKENTTDTFVTIPASRVEGGKYIKIAVASNRGAESQWTSNAYIYITPNSTRPIIRLSSNGVSETYSYINTPIYISNTAFAPNIPIDISWNEQQNATYTYNIIGLSGKPTGGSDESSTADWKITKAGTSETSVTIPADKVVENKYIKVAVAASIDGTEKSWNSNYYLCPSILAPTGEHLTDVPAGFAGIYSASDLQNVRNNLSGKYILMNDVDLSGNGNWDPVGTESTAFNGSFNGNGYVIKNASAASSSLDSVGLFGCNEGTIVNLTLGISASGNWCVGGIAGINKGTIQNCTVNGAVRNYSSSFDQTNGHSGSYVGGICGTNTGTITSCISSASTVASGSDVPNGCLAGQNYAGGTIQTSYAFGNVNGGIAGGLVGLNNAAHLEQNALIENCYALGNVNGNIAGGLVGRCRNHSTEYSGKGVIRNSYASNYVVGNNQDYVGGIVGDVACNYEVSGCYYNSEISTCTDTNKGSPRNNTQMQSSSTFTGWAMGSVWNVAANVNNGYPYLRGIEATNRNLNGDKASDFTYKFTDNNKTVQITGYQGTRVDVTIPAIIEGKPVTSISGWAFQNRSDLLCINLPDTMLTVSEYAFSGCTKLNDISFGNSVRSIGYGAFYGCTELKDVSLPASIVSSPGCPFVNCGVKTATLKYGMTVVPSRLFDGCESLETVHIPSSVIAINEYAFCNCKSLKEVTLPKGLQKILCCGFAGCTNLESIRIPSGTTILSSQGYGAFRESGLKTVAFDTGTTKIPSYAFESCKQLKTVIIPSGVTTIESYAFRSCSAISKVELPNTVVSIGYAAFNGCNSLEEIGFGNSLQTIDAWAFAGCSKLEYVYIPKGITRLQSGGVGAFRDSGLVTIEFESGTTAIPDYCVQYCEHLTDVIIPTGVKTIGNYAFQSCTALQSVELPDTINAIGYSSFNGCSSLSDIDLGNGLQTIDAWAFAGCSKLKYVFIPKSITRLQSGGVGAFRDSGLVTVELEPGIDKIPEYSFERCENLATIDIPSSVKTVGNYAFYWCVSLTDIKLHTGLETLGYRSFSQCGMSSIILPDSLITIDSCAFQSCTELKDVDFGNTVQEIRGLAFSGCNSLESVYIPSSVKATSSGGSGAFERSGVVTVEFENGVQEITAYSFAYCENIEKVIIPRSVTDKKIGYRAFEGHTDKLTIYGYRGSYAQTYAEENSISFQEITSATGVILTPSSVTLYPSDTRQLTATVQPENATNPTVTWKSMNTAVASVSGTGLVTAVAPGTAKIMVTAWDGGWTAYSDITVLEPSLSFQTSTVSLQIGESFALEVSTAPENQIVTWNSSDSNVARIRNGVITARSNGSATITATMEYGGKTYTAKCIVTVGNVAPTLTGIKVKTLPIKTVYTEGDPFDQTGLTLTATYSDGNTQTVSSGFTCSGYQANTTGEQTIEVTYNGLKTSFTVMVNPKPAITLDSIAVTKEPTTTTYYVGDTLDTAGMAVTATYSDGSSKLVTGYTCDPTKLNTEGTQTITVSYTEGDVTKTATFNVTVKPVPVLLDSIAVTKQPTKTTYYVGDTLNTAGMEVTAMYSDNSSKTVTGWTCSPTKLNTKGTQTITVSYTEGSVTKTATFGVTVNEKDPGPDVTLSSIAVTKNPTKAIYDIGEPLDTAGIVITATYSDGSTKTISASGCTFTGFDSSSAGVKTITVTYQRKTDTFDVTVRESVPTSNGQIYVDPAKGYIGQRFDVTIRLQNNPGLVAARLEIGYDAGVLKLVDAKNGEVITGGSFITSQTFEKNPYVAMWHDSTARVDYTADGVLLTLTFEVLKTAEAGTTEITVNYEPDATFNQEMQNKALTIHNGTVEITERVIGDADGDGVLNLKDVVVLRRMLAGWEGYSINDTNADVDGDGKVTLKDAVLLERYLAGWEVTLK